MNAKEQLAKAIEQMVEDALETTELLTCLAENVQGLDDAVENKVTIDYIWRRVEGKFQEKVAEHVKNVAYSLLRSDPGFRNILKAVMKEALRELLAEVLVTRPADATPPPVTDGTVIRMGRTTTRHVIATGPDAEAVERTNDLLRQIYGEASPPERPRPVRTNGEGAIVHDSMGDRPQEPDEEIPF